MERYLELLGAIIKKAISDYHLKGETNWMICDDARNFLDTNRLENFLKHYHIELMINPGYVRKQIEKYKDKKLYRILNTEDDDGETEQTETESNAKLQ